MHTLNINTAASESPKTWVKDAWHGLPEDMVSAMKQLTSLCAGYPELYGAARHEMFSVCITRIIHCIVSSVTDWQTPRPKIPAQVVAAWMLTRKMAVHIYGEVMGAEAWQDGVIELAYFLKLTRHQEITGMAVP